MRTNVVFGRGQVGVVTLELAQANEASGNIVVFAVDAASGLLTQTAEEEGGMPTAMCLVFAPREPAAAPAL